MLAGPRSLALSLFLLTAVAVTSAQTASTPPLKPLTGSILSNPAWPQPKPSDVTSVDAIIHAIYDVISGPAGQPRDPDRMRSLFLPDARLIPTQVLPGSPDSANPNTDAVPLTVNAYIQRSFPRFATMGFFERGISNRIEQYDNIVHVWSTYESRHAATDPQPFARGINSFQLLKDGNRYWIVNIFWDAERPSRPIPAQYLPAIANSTPPEKLNANFYGDWVGQLEYRDFSSNEQTFLPTWLTLTPEPDGNTIHITYIYDDGPTKTVRESSTLTLSPATSKATLTSDRDKSTDTYTVQGYTEFAKLGRGTLILTGTGQENDKPVDVRITLTLRRNLYTFRKDTKLAGEDFKFRDAYTFTRANPPQF
jgi:hypothetical protein